MKPMVKRAVFASFLTLLFLGATGCVSEERHDQTVAEVNRLRAEASQRTYEAAALRQMLDRVTVELRTMEPVNMELIRRYGELANSFGEVSKQCAPQGAREPEIRRRTELPPGSSAAGREPGMDAARARQIDDRLFDDRH
jgi:outer membrane murein-binding lipoprotein Lpp